jgi:hypothetical protein
MDPSLNARSVLASAGTSVFFTLATVGTDDACTQLTTTVFSLSVKVTELPLVVRAQPSGVEITKPPALEVNGTNAALSGMSPGGLLSTGIGDSVGIGDSEDLALGEVAPGAGGLVTAGFAGAALVGDRPPQALNGARS